MFSDDEEFSDDMLELDDGRSPSPAAVKDEEEEFRELIKKREMIEKKMDDVDDLAKQMKFALELQRAMTDCYSNRVSSLPIDTLLELRCLSSGSFLIVFSMRNNTTNDLFGWTITASLVPPTMAKSNIGSFSQSITMESLSPGEEFSSELFFPQSLLHLPLIVRLSLKKTFNVGDEVECVLVELDSEYLSLRDLLHAANPVRLTSDENERSSVMNHFTLRLPCCFVDLLAGCPDDNDPANVLRILLPKHRFRWLPAGTSSADALLVLDSCQKHKVQFTVSKDRGQFTVCVSLPDAALRDRLRQALQLYLIHMSSRVLKRPLSNSLSVVGCETVDEMFESVMSSYLK